MIQTPMNRKRFLRNVLLIGVTASLLLFLTSPLVFAQDATSVREQRREIIPAEKLILFLESPERLENMQPERVLDTLNIQKGESIADVGAGTGFFTFRLAGRVGDEGRVYAVEIEDKLLDYMRAKMEKNGVTNIIPIKSSAPDPNLPPECCDKILVFNTYYYLSDPITFMTNTRRGLKPGGMLAIIGLDPDKSAKLKRGLFFPGKGPSVTKIINEMKDAGFVFRKSFDFLGPRFFLIFSANE